MTITSQTIITAAAVLTALGVIGGLALKLVKWVQTQNQQSTEIKSIKDEQTLLTYGVLACLKGLAEQGCDGPVHEAIDKIEKHLNKKAHE